jgi:anti-sigma factor RsiW
MTCREFADFMADYLSGELPAGSRSKFEQHLEVCANCVKYIAGYKATIELGRAAFDDPDAPAPDYVPEDLVQAILSAKR